MIVPDCGPHLTCLRLCIPDTGPMRPDAAAGTGADHFPIVRSRAGHDKDYTMFESLAVLRKSAPATGDRVIP